MTAKLFFSCYHKPPQVNQALPLFSGQLDYEKDKCGACGYLVLATGSLKVAVECDSCSRKYHRICIDELAVPVSNFCCKMVKRHLGIDGSELFEPVQERQRPINRKFMCLICGVNVEQSPDIVSCSKKCGYGAHNHCIDLLKHVVRKIDCHFEFGSEFACADVIYQFKPKEVSDCIDFLHGRVTRARRSNASWSFVARYVRGLVKVLKNRGRVDVRKYSTRERRWENDDHYCKYCKQWVSINEYDHYESWCKGISGTPVSSSKSVYIRSRCKRFRHLIRAESVI
jgi:hypothetical protein